MNAVDIVILVIIGFSVLFGLYRGFISAIASLGGCLVGMGLSFWLSPKLVEVVKNNQQMMTQLKAYTDASSRIGDISLALTNVANLTAEKITEILNKVSLPEPLDSLLKNNLLGQNFSSEGITKVGDYVSETIMNAVLSVLCFLVCFVGIFLVWHAVLNLLKVIFRFPVLKQVNSLAGGILGLLRGALLCFIAFALLPLIQTVVPMDEVNQLIESSLLAPYFNSGSMVTAIMNGGL